MNTIDRNKVVINLEDVILFLYKEADRIHGVYSDLYEEHINLSHDEYYSNYGQKLHSEVLEYSSEWDKINSQISKLEEILGEYKW